jgi:hypothetical protein
LANSTISRGVAQIGDLVDAGLSIVRNGERSQLTLSSTSATS